MGVYIKGMEMPISCADCPIGDSLRCSLMPGVPALWREYTLAIRTNRRYDDCPLVPVPKHGRLIDESDVVAALLRDKDYAATLTVRICPTIIPAEDGRNDV